MTERNISLICWCAFWILFAATRITFELTKMHVLKVLGYTETDFNIVKLNNQLVKLKEKKRKDSE